MTRSVELKVESEVWSEVDSSVDDGVPSELKSLDTVADSGVVEVEEDEVELIIVLVVGSIDSVDSEDGPVGSLRIVVVDVVVLDKAASDVLVAKELVVEPSMIRPF